MSLRDFSTFPKRFLKYFKITKIVASFGREFFLLQNDKSFKKVFFNLLKGQQNNQKIRKPFPLVLVKKKDRTFRFCVDYRKLNEITVKDNYQLPMINGTIDNLDGSKCFTNLDLASGYWQISIDEESKEKTAFISKKGLYEFNEMPFGLCNAGATFQRTMETILGDLNNLLCYLDDIMVHSKTFEDHLEHLEKVFKKLSEANLKSNLANVSLVQDTQNSQDL